MKKFDLQKTIRYATRVTTKHSPEILTGIGITGMIATTVMAVGATPKALRLIDDKADHLYLFDEHHEKVSFTPIDYLKIAGPCYIPAAITCIASVACLIGANSVNAKRNAALATAYTLSEKALKLYQEKVIETIGEKKEQEVQDKVAKAQIDKRPVSTCEVIITEKGNTLCHDTISGRYFRSDIDKIKKAQNELNRKLMTEMYISLNEFYYELGLRQNELGNELGWNIDDGLIDLHFGSQIADDGNPCLVIDYHIAPRYDYAKLM